MFRQPYSGLAAAVFAYFVFCFLVHPLSPLRTGLLADPDDYMRLNEAISWMQGQGWYDLTVPRMSPGAHTVVHWARLIDIPLAALAWPFAGFLDLRHAVLAASFVIPPVGFSLLLMLARGLARPLAGGARAGLACMLALFAPMTAFNFTPGRVDHHGAQILIAGFSLLALERMTRAEQGSRFALAAAAAFACGLWIGAEALPWLLVFAACLGGMAAWEGGSFQRTTVMFGVALPVAVLLVWPLAVAPENYGDLALSWFSTADVILAALTGASLTGMALLCKKIESRGARLFGAGAFGIAAAAVFVALVPEAAQGPFANYDDFNAHAALTYIREAQPLVTGLAFNIHNRFTYLPAMMTFSSVASLPLAALIYVVVRLRRAERGERRVWLLHGAFLLVSMLLALFWQVRVAWFMQMFAIAPLTALLGQGLDRADKALTGPLRSWAKGGIILLLGPLPVVVIPAIAYGAILTANTALFPAARAENECAARPVAEFLARPSGLGPGRETIMAGPGIGPELLFRTPHDVITGNYNVAGNRDGYTFFATRDEHEALRVARKWRVTLVMLCRAQTNMYRDMRHARFGSGLFLRPGTDGKLELAGNPQHPVFAERLAQGRAPGWLEKIDVPDGGGYALYRVVSGQGR